MRSRSPSVRFVDRRRRRAPLNLLSQARAARWPAMIVAIGGIGADNIARVAAGAHAAALISAVFGSPSRRTARR
jgi:thiamine monophosphate synthase